MDTTKITDRRVRRTHKQLRDALLALILETGYDAITIQDIVDRADLSRATFYLHYRDKEELLVSSLEEMFDALLEAKGQVTPDMLLPNGQPPCFLAFQHAQEYSALYKVMLSERGVAYVMHRIQDYLTDEIRFEIETLLNQVGRKPDVPLDIIATHMAGALFSSLVWWIENDMPYQPEYMAQTFQRMMMPAIFAGVGLSEVPVKC
jgi:AcrR family transcriptional regulator